MNKQKKHCSDCKLYWTHGVKDGAHNNWCCEVGQPADKAWKHCINSKLKQPKGDL